MTEHRRRRTNKKMQKKKKKKKKKIWNIQLRSVARESIPFLAH